MAKKWGILNGQSHPSSALADFQTADKLFRINNLNAVIKSLDSALNLNPDLKLADLLRYMILLHKGEKEAALETANRLTSQDKLKSEAGESYFQSKQIPMGITQAETMAKNSSELFNISLLSDYAAQYYEIKPNYKIGFGQNSEAPGGAWMGAIDV
ncbi:MAG: hypothetical protein WBM27_07720 [bacterium]